MSELTKRLERLFSKLDHTALLVEQMLADALFTLESGKDEDIETLIQSDAAIDSREIETERECIRLLALYQPAAIDLRRICFVVKANSDLERIADYCVKIVKRGRRLSRKAITIQSFPAFFELAEQVGATYRKTIRLFTLYSEKETVEHAESSLETARAIIAADGETDVLFREFFEQTLAVEQTFHNQLKVWYDLVALGRALERIGDLCTNIAEDAVFMFSGEIIRHHVPNAPSEVPDSVMIIDG